MNASRRRSLWFLLACAALAAVLWTHRNEYAACDTDGCVVINRWTGAIDFRETGVVEEEPPGETLVTRERAPVDRARRDAERDGSVPVRPAGR